MNLAAATRCQHNLRGHLIETVCHRSVMLAATQHELHIFKYLQIFKHVRITCNITFMSKIPQFTKKCSIYLEAIQRSKLICLFSHYEIANNS